MRPARVRLIVAAVMFVAWIGYLAYLAFAYPKPIMVSRAQMLVATHFVKADVALDGSGKPIPLVHVRDSFGSRPVANETITVDNFGEARLPGGKPLSAPGTYLLPLKQSGPGKFQVVGAPTGQGYDVSGRHYWVYPWSDEVERQLRERLPKPE